MRKLLTSKWFIILVTVLILIVIIGVGFIPGSPIRQMVKPVSGIASPVQAFVKNIGDMLGDARSALFDGMAIRKENEDLKEQIAQLQYALTQSEEAAIRYEELKEALHIKDTFSSYDVYGAAILSRDADEWFSVIRADAGARDGVDLASGDAYAVVDVEMSLVGRVIETDDSNSKILTLMHESFRVSCKVNEVNGAYVTCSGDAVLKKKGLCLLTDIDPDVVLEAGDVIVTSGEGGLFPEGIPVGTVESVDYSDPLNITATLKPYTDVSQLKDVFIMIPIQADAAVDDSTEATSEEAAQ
ncbi:MAG: rod shape-determining protein MreC [Clostridiales bacterium]|nr:rod shape-determining protein MreC [Clostridiales bacterium]